MPGGRTTEPDRRGLGGRNQRGPRQHDPFGGSGRPRCLHHRTIATPPARRFPRRRTKGRRPRAASRRHGLVDGGGSGHPPNLVAGVGMTLPPAEYIFQERPWRLTQVTQDMVRVLLILAVVMLAVIYCTVEVAQSPASTTCQVMPKLALGLHPVIAVPVIDPLYWLLTRTPRPQWPTRRLPPRTTTTISSTGCADPRAAGPGSGRTPTVLRLGA